MPEIRLQHVVSVSSEDKQHKAENLLKVGGTGKWKCAKPGEAMAAVIFQLEKETAIDAIHIGNECSAFVEVLVGKAAASSDKDFQVLLISSAFMSPTDSRNNTNTNSVRIFKSDALMKPTASQKWDRIKVVCTQPFNKTVTYGLSFIKLLSPEREDAEQPKKFGAFTLKRDDVDDSAVPLSRFPSAARSSDAAGESTVSTCRPTAAVASVGSAAAVSSNGRSTADSTATTSADTKSVRAVTKSASSVVAEARPAEKPKPSIPSAVASASTRPTKRAADDDDGSVDRKKKAKLADPAATRSGASGSSSAAASKDEAGPFDRLFSGVVFVLSGFQNPLRSDLRDMAVQMGARYRPDWDAGCTHLICAFPNTPKYNEVVSKGGNIVSKTWILESHRQRRLLPWKDYSMLSASSIAESKAKRDSEPSRASDTPPRTGKAKNVTSDIKAAIASPKGGADKSGANKTDDDDVDYGGSTDVDSDDEERPSVPTVRATASGASPNEIDTDDEIEFVRNQKKPASHRADSVKGSGCISADVPALPEYFTGMNFFFYQPPEHRERLERYIVAYGGEVEQYMTAKVTHVVTSAAWDRNFDDAKRANPKITFVKPEWIVAVHDSQKPLPCLPFVVDSTCT